MSVVVQLSDQLQELVQQIAPAVVQVRARSGYPVSGTYWGNQLVVTASRMVDRESEINIVLSDGVTATANLVGRDPTIDLALLRIEGGGQPEAAPQQASASAVGQLVLAAGRPGEGVTASMGMVNQVVPAGRTRAGGAVDESVMADFRPFRGFTGGPLVNTQGAVLGINARGGGQGRVVTLPVATIERVTAALAEHGRIRRGYLGVSTQQVPIPDGLRQIADQDSGLLVVSVEPDSPADRVRLVLGDVLVAFGDAVIATHADLLAFLEDHAIGQEQQLHIVRGGKAESVAIVPTERQ